MESSTKDNREGKMHQWCSQQNINNYLTIER